METNEKATCEALAAQDVSEMLRSLGWSVQHVPIPSDAWPAWGWYGEPVAATVVATEPGCRVVAVDGALQRELVAGVYRQAPLQTVLWIFLHDGELTLATACAGTDGRARVRTMALECARPDAMGFERLLLLDRDAFARPNELDPAAAAAAHFAEVLDQEGLTRAFFNGFRAALEQMATSVRRGPTAPGERWHASLVVLLRLVFVYFLQREGLLDGDRRYVVRRLRSRPGAFFDTVLRPLFFGVLNTPPEARAATAASLGEIPFLNGGLFDPTPVEQEHPAMSWDDAVLAGVIEDLFERFHFTAAEPTGEDEARVVDPEMLGKVFEGLMYGDERRRAGAFYTPRDIVRRMVDGAIDGYLADRASDGIDEDAALQMVRILDPAVGTGAFLLEALASIRSRRREAGLPVDYAAMRRVVHEHLYGVDRNRTAVRLCELRIWLVMLAAIREETGPIAPLPNLSHRIAAGDSLLDGIDLVRRRTGGLHADVLVELVRLEARLARAQERFLEAHGHEKVGCRREVEELERAVQRQLIQGRRGALERRLAPLHALEGSTDLFGEAMATDDQRQHARALEAQIERLDGALRDVAHDRRAAPGFGYESRFGAVAREGFDVIVTNPPWVRAQHVDAGRRAVLNTRYRTAGGDLWPGARALGIRTHFGAQPDLAALFVERSLELLRPGGRLAALIPAKLFRGLHGCAMRRLLQQHRIEQIEDMSDADRQLFEATVYPAIIHVRKGAPDETLVDVKLWRGDRCDSFKREMQALGPASDAGEPWLLVPDRVDAILRHARARCRMLGELEQLAPRRGVFTGANDVFVRPRGDFERELGPAVRKYVRPLVTGSGLGREPEVEILWCYDGDEPLTDVHDVVAGYFARHADRLRRRSDHDPRRPLWQVFRARPDTCAARVAWRDISVYLEPALVGPSSVALNTVYYVPFDDPAAAAGFARWMSSPVVRATAFALAERARGGWRRHFAWLVRMLPVPGMGTDWASFDARTAFGIGTRDEAVLREWLRPEAAAAA